MAIHHGGGGADHASGRQGGPTQTPPYASGGGHQKAGKAHTISATNQPESEYGPVPCKSHKMLGKQDSSQSDSSR